MWMSRGLGLPYETKDDSPHSPYDYLELKIPFDENGNKSASEIDRDCQIEIYRARSYASRSYVDQYDLHTFHTYKLNDTHSSRFGPEITNIFNQLMENSNLERNKFICYALCENPIFLNYNPNKSNSIYRENYGRIEKRNKNNVASRISRFKRKRQYQMSSITSEYLEGSNETLSTELNEMASIIRQREVELEQKFNSTEYVVQLREKCGLEACLF